MPIWTWLRRIGSWSRTSRVHPLLFSTFHGFGQAKLGYGGFRLKPIFSTPCALKVTRFVSHNPWNRLKSTCSKFLSNFKPLMTSFFPCKQGTRPTRIDRKESYKAQRKSYAKEKKRVERELLSTFKDQVSKKHRFEHVHFKSQVVLRMNVNLMHL